jgi:ubiquinone/menaquinone biosynthesis C-methylase UbiE
MKPWIEFPAEDSDALVAVFDDLPLWAAPFGLALLDTARMRGVSAALDVGCGAGFPLVELAERLGQSCRAVGLDPWQRGLDRAALKLSVRGVKNVELVCGVAERMPFEDSAFDLIVSNNGINNVSDVPRALAECARVARPGAQLVITANLPGTMRELYDVYETVLAQLGYSDARARILEHIGKKRRPLEETVRLIEEAGFERIKAREGSFAMRYADGTAIVKNWYMRLGFMEAWASAAEPADAIAAIGALETRLNELAAERGEIALTVPFACIEATRAAPR